jgi:hypothetical protein
MRLTLALAATAILAACGAPADDGADPVATEAADGASAATASAEPAVQTGLGIPASMHGRWGLVPADCTSTRGDAKGLITVSAGEIRFYESVGQVDSASERSDTAFRGRFAFTGEGMQWTREMALALGADRTTLVRSEFGADAMAEPLTYTKCA